MDEKQRTWTNVFCWVNYCFVELDISISFLSYFYNYCWVIFILSLQCTSFHFLMVGSRPTCMPLSYCYECAFGINHEIVQNIIVHVTHPDYSCQLCRSHMYDIGPLGLLYIGIAVTILCMRGKVTQICRCTHALTTVLKYAPKYI